MKPKTLDDLPDDAIFLVLSSLTSLQDTVRATSVNKRMRTFFHEQHFWRVQLLRDLYVKAPESEEGSKFYKRRLKEMEAERELCVAYLAAYRFVTATKVLVKVEKYSRLKSLNSTLEQASTRQFLSFVNGAFYDASFKNGARNSSSVENKLFHHIVGNCHRDDLTLISNNHLHALNQLPNKTEEYFGRSMGFFFVTLAMCNAHIHLLYLLRRMPLVKRHLLLQTIGPDMLCQAALFGHLEIAKILLEAGVNPNQYGLYQDEGEENNQIRTMALPLYFLFLLQTKKNRMIAKAGCIIEMTCLLLHHGANVDLPHQQMMGVGADVNLAILSLRATAQNFLGEMFMRPEKYTPLIMTRLRDSLRLIVDVPVHQVEDMVAPRIR